MIPAGDIDAEWRRSARASVRQWTMRDTAAAAADWLMWRAVTVIITTEQRTQRTQAGKARQFACYVLRAGVQRRPASVTLWLRRCWWHDGVTKS